MTTLAVTNTLSNGATIQASEHNTNYSDIVTYINNRNSGSSTWDAFSTSSATNVPFIANNSTGTQDIARFQDNGTNVLLIENGGYVSMASQSGCRVFRNTSSQSLTNSTKVQFNGETYDTQSEFDSATNYRFTATKDGIYYISAVVNITSPASAPQLDIFKNGSTIATYKAFNSGSGISHVIAHVTSLVATDYIEIFVNAGASGTLVSGSGTSFLSIQKLA